MFNFFLIHFFLSGFFLFFFCCVIFYELCYYLYKDIKYIDSDNAVFFLNNRDSVICDFRDRISYLQEHIPQSIHIDKDGVSISFLNKIHKRYNIIIVICDYKISVRKVFFFLRLHGFESVYFLRNGINGWSESGLFLSHKKEI